MIELFLHPQVNDLVSSARNAVIASMNDGVIVVDAEGRVKDLNPAAELILNQTPAEARNKLAAHVLAQASLLDDWNPTAGEFSEFISRPEPDPRWYEMRALPLANRQNQSPGQLILLRDVTEHKALEQKMQAQNRELEILQRRQAALADIRLTVSDSHKLPNILGELVSAAGELLPANAGASICLWSEQANASIGHCASPPANSFSAHLILPDSTVHWLATHREPLIVPDTNTSPVDSPSEFLLAGIRAYAIVPLLDTRSVLGTLNAYETTPRTYREEDIAFLSEIANRVMIVINQSRLFEQLGEMETRDELTGIANRRHLLQTGDQEIVRARQFGRPLAGLVFAPDHFQRLNQARGNAAGDQILRALAQTARENIRQVDILGRYGNDEFVILFPETNLSAACHVAERIRKKIAESLFSVQTDAVRVTLSLGVAEIGEETQQITDLIASAENAMQRAMQAGRNRIFFADHSLARHFYFDFLPA